MALKNLALKTLNADGSTTLFGAQGNAIEDLAAGSATTIFAVPTAPAVTPPMAMWYAPAITNQYFSNILNNPALFTTLGDVKVFKMYLTLDWPDSTLKAFFNYLSANNIKLGVEAPPLTANSGDPGAGIEGFAPAGNMIAAITRIQALGGTVSYLSWDEPLYFGSNSTGIYTMAQVASQVAASSAAVRAIFPNVQIGDIEPVDVVKDSPATLQAWFAAYAADSGTPFTSFQADADTGHLGWQSNLASTIAVAKADGIPVGSVIIGLGAAATDAAWSATATANALQMLSDPALRTNYLDVQSWQTNPSEVADPTTAGTLASVAADIEAGERAALAVPAAAHYTALGLLQSVTWSGGWTATQNGASLLFTSPTGTVVAQFAWSDVRVFTFKPDSGTVSLTVRSPSASATSAQAQQNTMAYAVNVAGGNFIFAPGSAPAAAPGVGLGSTLSLTLAPASTTGFAGSGVTNQLTPTFTGTAAPNTTIQLQVDGSSVGTAKASATGAWTFAIAAPLVAGAHLIEASGGTAPGTASQQSLYVVSVDPTQRLSSTLGLAPGSDTGYPGDGITDIAQPVLSGVDDPGVQIGVSIDGTQAGAVTTGVNGNWTYTPSSPLARGTHTVTVSAAGPPGTSSVPASMPLTIDTAAQETAMTGTDPLFDPAWYMQQHPGIAASATAAYTQYMAAGWKQGYDPSPFFSTKYYLTHNPDVAAAGVNPLLHFETYGWHEGRNPGASFNTASYAAANPGLPAGEDPLVAYINSLAISGAPTAASATTVPGGATLPASASLVHTTIVSGAANPSFGTIVTHT